MARQFWNFAFEVIYPNEIRLKGLNELANFTLGQNHLAANLEILRVKSWIVFRKVDRGVTVADDCRLRHVVEDAVEPILSATYEFGTSYEDGFDFFRALRIEHSF